MTTDPKIAMAAFLAQADPVVNIVGQSIYPDQAAELATEPYLEFQEVARNQKKGLSGPVGSIRSRFQLKGYCTTRVQAMQLQSALKALLDGTKFSIAGLTVMGSFIGTGDDDQDAVDEDEPPRPGEDSGLRNIRLDVLWVIAPY